MSDQEKADHIHQLNIKINGLTSDIQALREKIAQLAKMKKEVEGLYQKSQSENHSLRQTINDLEERLNGLEQENQKLQGKLDVASSQIDALNKQILNLEAKIKSLKEELRKKHEDWQNAMDKTKRLTNDLEAKKS
jgi:chromosome segregation ATPase